MGRKCWPSCVAAGGQEGANSWGPCLGEHRSRGAGCVSPATRSKLRFAERKTEGKVVQPSRARSSPAGRGQPPF